MDYERTRKYYEDAKQKYEKHHDEIEWEKWNKRVKDSAGNWNQNPHDHNIIYPIVKYNCLIRILAKDNKEYLLTRSMWTGVNAYGDEQTHSIVDPEKYIETKWNHRRIQDPNDRNNIITEASGVSSQTEIYTLPFTIEEVDICFAKPADEGIALVAINKRKDAQPREVITIEDFKSKSIDELVYGTKPTISNERPTAASKAK